jgi:LysR family hydrogen peroxide-inducible transcriptional activator
VAVLSTEPVLLLEEGHCLRDQALVVCRTGRRAERNGFRATSLETMRQMVAAGVGITLLPALSVQPPIPQSPDVAILHLTEPVPHRRLGLLWRPTTVHGALLPRIAEALRDLPPELWGIGPA